MAAQLDEHTVYQGSDGKPLVDGYLYIGTEGADPKLNTITIYSDRELTTTISNPQRLDAYGRATNKIWVPDRYSLKVENSNNVQVYQNLYAGETPVSGVTTLTNVQGINAVTAEAVPAITSYTDGEVYIFKPASTNTGAMTLNAGGGAVAVQTASGAAFIGGEFVAGRTAAVVYNGSVFHTPGPMPYTIGAAGYGLMSNGTAYAPFRGAWEVVTVNNISADATFDMYHDGFDGSVDFIAGWDYRMQYQIFGTVNDYLSGELYEGGAYRTASYAANELIVTSPTAVAAANTVYSHAPCSIRWGATNELAAMGNVEFRNLANTNNFLIITKADGYPTTPAQRIYEARIRPNAGSTEDGVTTHIKFEPATSGTITGRVIWERRYVG